MRELGDEARGTFEVITETSRYLIELDPSERWLTRQPGLGDGSNPAVPGAPCVALLRQDAQKIPLVSIEECQVGYPATFAIRMPADQHGLGADYAGTMRVTTAVRRIAQLESARADFGTAT